MVQRITDPSGSAVIFLAVLVGVLLVVGLVVVLVVAAARSLLSNRTRGDHR